LALTISWVTCVQTSGRDVSAARAVLYVNEDLAAYAVVGEPYQLEIFAPRELVYCS